MGRLSITLDEEEYSLNADLLLCLQDDQESYAYFLSLARHHQNYFSKYVDSAKTEPTKAKRIAKIIRSMQLKENYSEMFHNNKDDF